MYVYRKTNGLDFVEQQYNDNLFGKLVSRLQSCLLIM